jgi:hypothetical protein
MQPNRCRGRLEGRHTLGKQRRDKAGENIAAPTRRKLWRRVGIYDRASIGGGDDGVGPFEHYDGVAQLRRTAGALQLVTVEMEKAHEFASPYGNLVIVKGVLEGEHPFSLLAREMPGQSRN